MESLKILLLEDCETDAEIVMRLLKKEATAFEFSLTMTKEAYIEALASFQPDVILADNSLPQFNATEALNIANHLALDIPFILVTGTVSEEFAVDIIKRGADDYILKDRLTRLPAAIETAIKNRRSEKEKAAALEQLVKSEEKYRTLVEQASDGIFIADSDGRFIIANNSACKLSGYSFEELKALTIYDLVHPQSLAADPFHFEEMMQPQGARSERRMICKDNTVLDIELSAKFLNGNNRFIAFVRDISERKRAEEKIIKANRLYAFISQVNQMIVRTTDENKLFSDICQIAIEYGKFKMAWIGLLDEATQKINPVMQAGDGSEYLASTHSITINEGPIGTAIRQGRYYVCNDIQKDPAMAAWKEASAQRKYQSCISLPVNKSGKVIGMLKVYSGEKNFFDDTEIALLQEAASDLSFALEVFDKEKLRKDAEARVVANEKKFRKLVENGNDAFAILDTAGQPTYVSSSVERVLGYSEQEVYGMDMFTLVHPDNVADVQQTMQVVMKNPGVPVVSHLSRLLHKDGTYHWFEDTITNLLHDPDVSGIVDNFRDVTERVKADEAIKASEEKYRMLVEQAFDGIIIYSPDGTILDCNLSACKNTGYTIDELKTLNVARLFFEEDLAARPLYFDSLKAGHSTLDYRRLKRKDGSYAEMEIGTKMTPDGNLMAIGRDITERKKAQQQLEENEKRFRALVEHNEGIISLLDTSLHTVFRSNSAARITGWTHEEFEQIDTREYIHPDDAAYVEEITKVVLAYHGHPVPVSLRVKHKKGHYVWLEGVMTNLLNEPGIKGIVSNLRDITERKKAEEILNEEREKFSKIAATAPGLIYSFRQSPDGTFSFPYTSAAVEGLFGFRHDEIEHDVNKIFALGYPGDIKHVMESIARSAATMQPWNDEFRYQHPEKGMIWLEGNSIPMAEPDGSIIWHGIIADVTERKKTAEKIFESETNLKAIFDNTSEGFVLIDTNHIVKAFNGMAKESIFPGGADELKTGSNIFDFVEAPRADFLKKILSRVMKGESIQYDRSYTMPGEQIAWINFSINPVRMDGAVNGICIAGRNITNSKKAEEELKNNYIEKQILAERMSTILRTLPANIALLNKKGIIIDVNESWKKFAANNGFEGTDYGIGLDYIEVSHNAFAEEEEDGKIVAKGIRDIVNNKLDEFVYEYPCHSLLEKRWFRMVVKPISGKENNGAVVMHVDITQLRQMEQERMESKTEEQKNITQAMILGQEKERNAIGRELHDNLNQILAGINLLLGMLKSKPERLQEYLPLCIEHINLAITENRKIAHELVSPNQLSESLVSQVERLCTNMLQNAGLATTIEHAGFNEDLLKADQKLAIYRVVQEQCTNIVKYAQAGNVAFALSTGGDMLTLSIKDDGQGMKEGKSTDGIGLQNMMSRVSVLNGRLNIETKPGKGFALHVEIPLISNGA